MARPPASVMTAAEERVDVVDADDHVVGTVTRAVLRADNLRHRAVFVLVVSSRGEVLVHRRSPTKDVWPGWWDVAVGGVVAAGETYEVAARRELAEELGVAVCAPEPLGGGSYEDDHVRLIGRVYRVVHDGPFTFADGEVVDARFVDRGRARRAPGPPTPSCPTASPSPSPCSTSADQRVRNGGRRSSPPTREAPATSGPPQCGAPGCRSTLCRAQARRSHPKRQRRMATATRLVVDDLGPPVAGQLAVEVPEDAGDAIGVEVRAGDHLAGDGHGGDVDAGRGQLLGQRVGQAADAGLADGQRADAGRRHEGQPAAREQDGASPCLAHSRRGQLGRQHGAGDVDGERLLELGRFEGGGLAARLERCRVVDEHLGRTEVVHDRAPGGFERAWVAGIGRHAEHHVALLEQLADVALQRFGPPGHQRHVVALPSQAAGDGQAKAWPSADHDPHRCHRPTVGPRPGVLASRPAARRVLDRPSLSAARASGRRARSARGCAVGGCSP